MKTIPAELVMAKNLLNSPSPWLILVELTLVDPQDPGTTAMYRVVRNPADVVYGGNTYSAFPFEIEPTTSGSRGEIPVVKLRICNVGRAIQADLERFNGGMGSTVKLTVVNAANLAVSHADLEATFDVIGASSDSKWAEFTLGAPNPLRQRFPLDRFIPTHCNWPYKGCECAYAGELPTCNRTYEDCVAHANAANFGGFMGLRAGGLRVA